jgi:hypothetical protein
MGFAAYTAGDFSAKFVGMGRQWSGVRGWFLVASG